VSHQARERTGGTQLNSRKSMGSTQDPSEGYSIQLRGLLKFTMPQQLFVLTHCKTAPGTTLGYPHGGHFVVRAFTLSVSMHSPGAGGCRQPGSCHHSPGASLPPCKGGEAAESRNTKPRVPKPRNPSTPKSGAAPRDVDAKLGSVLRVHPAHTGQISNGLSKSFRID